MYSVSYFMQILYIEGDHHYSRNRTNVKELSLWFISLEREIQPAYF